MTPRLWGQKYWKHPLHNKNVWTSFTPTTPLVSIMFCNKHRSSSLESRTHLLCFHLFPSSLCPGDHRDLTYFRTRSLAFQLFFLVLHDSFCRLQYIWNSHRKTSVSITTARLCNTWPANNVQWSEQS